MTKQTAEEQTNKTPVDELIKDALDHYDEIASEAGHWESIIPRALQFYAEWHKMESNMQGVKEENYNLGFKAGTQAQLQEILEEIETLRHPEDPHKHAPDYYIALDDVARLLNTNTE